jgi:hypothetical protein
MMKKAWLSVALFAGLLAVGCNNPTDPTGPSKTPAAKDAGKAVAEAKKVDDHSGWWCDEHGVPEDECSMCSAKVAKAAKAKGDWCEKHDRAKSICFICDPSLKEKYAAKYVAKFGKQPPEPEGQIEEKDDKK